MFSDAEVFQTSCSTSSSLAAESWQSQWRRRCQHNKSLLSSFEAPSNDWNWPKHKGHEAWLECNSEENNKHDVCPHFCVLAVVSIICIKVELWACLKNRCVAWGLQKHIHSLPKVLCVCPVCVRCYRMRTGWFIILVGYAGGLRRQLSGCGTVPRPASNIQDTSPLFWSHTLNLITCSSYCGLLMVLTWKQTCLIKRKSDR